MTQTNRRGFLIIAFCTLPLLAGCAPGGTTPAQANKDKPAEAGEPAATKSQSAGISGSVELGGKPLEGATVTLWATSGAEAPKELATASSGDDGSFTISDGTAPEDSVLYIVARDEAKQLALLSFWEPIRLQMLSSTN